MNELTVKTDEIDGRISLFVKDLCGVNFAHLTLDEAKYLQRKLDEAIKEAEAPKSLTLFGSDLEIKVGDIIVFEGGIKSPSILKVTRLNNDLTFNSLTLYPSTGTVSDSSLRASNASGCINYRRATNLEKLFFDKKLREGAY